MVHPPVGSRKHATSRAIAFSLHTIEIVSVAPLAAKPAAHPAFDAAKRTSVFLRRRRPTPGGTPSQAGFNRWLVFSPEA